MALSCSSRNYKYRKAHEYKTLFTGYYLEHLGQVIKILYLKKDLIPLQKEFSKIRCKVYFIHGDKDNWVPIKNVAYGMKMLINAKSVTADTIFGADHQIPWKNKSEFTKLLLNIY